MSIHHNRGSMLSEINITPFVDVMLVLLVIFMVTTPMMQQGIDVDLPETTSLGVTTPQEPFVLVIHRNGQIKTGSTNLHLKTLRQKLIAIFETRENKQVYIQADRRVDYGIVAEVMAEVKAAGISNIGLVTLPRSE